MVTFASFVLIIFLIICLSGFIFVTRFFRLLSKAGGNNRQQQYQRNNTYGNQSAENHPSSEHQKVFGKDEGEYIDYEDIK